MTRSNACHNVWDSSLSKVDSAELRGRMDQVDLELRSVLAAVIQGNMAPDLSALNEGLKTLKDVANRRLDARI